MERREFVGMAALSLVAGCAGCAGPAFGRIESVEEAYGLIGQMLVADGMRDLVVAALVEGTGDMPAISPI